MALGDILRDLRAEGYRFVVPTLRTAFDTRVRRTFDSSRTHRDIFGWNLPFRRSDIDSALHDRMARADLLDRLVPGRLRSRLRVASVGDDLLLHSPSGGRSGTVFLGPDSYRFARFVADHQDLLPHGARVVDLGAGAGAGAIALARARPDLHLTLVDINPQAVRLARINLAAAGIAATVIAGAGLAAVAGRIDAVIANPPFLAGAIRGVHRNGGGLRGAAVTLAWMRECAARLAPGGTILLYGASAIVAGRDAVQDALERELSNAGFTVRYRELDPDVFGGMLWRPAYRGVERIAAITMVATRRC